MTEPSARIEEIGNERQPVVIVDDFAPDPHALVRQAGDLSFSATGEFYPGVRAAAPPSYARSVGPLVSEIVRRVFAETGRLTFDRALYSLVTTPPAELALAQRIPHIDGLADKAIAIVHYLTSNDFGGTSFWRHRATGFETVNKDRHSTYLRALEADFACHGQPAAEYVNEGSPIFACTATVAPHFNRAIIYRSAMLHCASIATAGPLSPDPANGRLTIASFLSIR